MTRLPSRRAILAAAALSPMTACGAREVLGATISITPLAQGPVVPELLFGSNLQWTGDGDGALTPDQSGGFSWDPALSPLMNQCGLSLLRFPGGALSNTYRWRDGVGPRASRAAGLNFSGAPEPSVFGSDELIALAAKTGTSLFITTNVLAGPEEAADWVEYINGASTTTLGALRVSNTGSGPLSVRWWEVGNELYSAKEPGHSSAAAYASAVIAFRDAIRLRDPDAQVGAMLEGSFQAASWVAGTMPQLTTWNAEVLNGCGGEIDFVSLHFSAPYDNLWSAKDLSQLTLAGNLVLRATIAEIKVRLARLGRPSLPIIVSEYTAYYGGTPSARIESVEGGLFDALALIELMRQPTVAAAANWSLLNNGPFGLMGATASGLSPRASYTALSMLRSLAGLPTAPLSIVAPSYAVAAKGNIPALAQVPMLDGAAVIVSPGRYRLAVVNRSAYADVTAGLTGGLTIASGVLRADGGVDWLAPQPLTAGSNSLMLPAGSIAVMDVMA